MTLGQSGLVVLNQPLYGLPASQQSGEEFIWVVSLLIFHNVIAGSGEFVCQCFHRYAGIATAFFLFIEFLCLRTMANSFTGGFNEGPSQIFITILAVARPFLFAVAGAAAIDAAAV